MSFWNWIKSLFDTPAKKATGAASAVLIAAKDVPFGRPYKIVDVSELPQDRATRNAWTVDDAILTDGVGADYGAGSDLAVVAWQEDGQPVVDQVRVDDVAGAVSARKSSIIRVRT